MAAIRVLIVDDHAVFADALATILGTESDVEVVGKGGTVQEAINAARALGPDVVLLDVHMPDGSGIEAAAAIKKYRPQTQVVILTSDEEESVLQSAIQAGVTGYLSKHETAAQVVQAVRSASRGEALIAPTCWPASCAAYKRRMNRGRRRRSRPASWKYCASSRWDTTTRPSRRR